jgi:hypothetical protein
MVLKRQPWYDREHTYGGILQFRATQGHLMHHRDNWVAHTAFWSNNPMLTTRGFMAAHPWPQKSGSENLFTRQLFDNNTEHIVGMWGRYDDPPHVTHIGQHRAGHGY